MAHESEDYPLNSDSSFPRRPIPLGVIVMIAAAIHAPLLIMELPQRTSYDANFHMFFASHYAQHWFNPWNEKWFAGFSQTTYPPLVHQWIALLSRLIGLNEAFSVVMLGSTPAGDAYTFPELERMFANAGFARSELHQLPPSIEQVVISYK